MTFEIIARSDVHPGRMLLRGSNGSGYIQLAIDTDPIAVPEHDFIRLRAMRHYRLVTPDLPGIPLAVVSEPEHVAF